VEASEYPEKAIAAAQFEISGLVDELEHAQEMMQSTVM
jgi:hypothetical protein